MGNLKNLTELELLEVSGGKNLLEYISGWLGEATGGYMNHLEDSNETAFGHYGGARP